METEKTYSTRSNAISGARTALKNPGAVSGVDFVLLTVKEPGKKGETRWAWSPAPKPEPVAVPVRTPSVRPANRRPVMGSTEERAPTKESRLIARLREDGGAAALDLQAEFGWLPHTLRGAISTLGKKLGVKIESFRSESGTRYYRLPPA